MILAQAVEEFLVAGEADGLSKSTMKWYRSLLGAYANASGQLELFNVTVSDIRRYIVNLDKSNFSADTINAHKRALHRFWKWCSREYGLPNPMLNIRYPKQAEVQEPKAITIEDVLKIYEAAQIWRNGKHPQSVIRDPAIVALLLDSGGRAGGIISLRVSGLDMDNRTAIVIEKGKKKRKIVFTAMTAQILTRWLKVRGEQDTLFYNLKTGKPLTVNGLYLLLKRLAGQAGVKARWNPHAFRHAFAREYLRAGGDLATLSRLLGHNDVSTTANHYAVFTQDELSEVHESLSPMRLLKNQTSSKKEDI